MNSKLLDEKDAWEGIKGFPQNRTLYVDQFSDGNPMTSDAFEGFQARNLDNVFEHYQPVKEVELKTENGESVLEHFRFRSIDDFEDEQLIEQSELLSAEEDKINTYNDIIFKIEKNKTLRNTLMDEAACSELKNAIATLLAELTQKNVIENSIKQENYLLLKGIIKRVEYMDPSRVAARNIFLSDSSYADTRQKLTNELNLWASIFGKEKQDLAAIIESCKTSRNEAELNLQSNLFLIHEETNQLEVAYRTLDAFFANVGQENTEILTVMSVSHKEIQSLDSEGSLAIRKELKKQYDALSLKNSYSLFIVPGYLGDAPTLREWAEIAYKNKVLLVTDFMDCPTFMTLKDELEDANLQGQEVFLSHVIVCCNYLLDRKKSELANEDDDIYIPGSGALAGRLANTKEISIAQGVVGRDYGFLNNVKGTRLNLLKSEIAVLVAQGVIPLQEIDGQTFALSNRSIYNGSAFSLQEYPIVRVLDWVNKVLMNYMHDIALETWDTYVSPQKLENKIRDFLDHYRGYQLLFSNYKLAQPKQDPITKIVTVDISITPFYSSKNLVIKLEADNKDYMSSDLTIEQ